MTPIRVQRARKKGSKLPPNTVCVSRGTRYGNPFRVVQYDFDKKWVVKCSHNEAEAHVIMDHCEMSYDTKEEAVKAAINCYAVYFMPYTHGGTLDECYLSQLFLEQAIQDLKGKNLACWCKVGESCHGDWLLEIANKSIA